MTTTISTLCLGSMDNFVYFIKDNVTKHTFIVDPSCEPKTLEKHLVENDCDLQGVLLTHSHGDHIGALRDIVNKYRVPTYITHTEFEIGRARVENTIHIEDGETITLGESTIKVIETAGHTMGGVCFQLDKALITGDTLFINGCGRCDFAESDIDAMWDSIQRLKTLPDDLVVYSGHDYGVQATDTLSNQKRTNPYLLIDDKDFFADFRLKLQSKYRQIPFQPSSLEEMQAIHADNA